MARSVTSIAEKEVVIAAKLFADDTSFNSGLIEEVLVHDHGRVDFSLLLLVLYDIRVECRPYRVTR